MSLTPHAIFPPYGPHLAFIDFPREMPFTVPQGYKTPINMLIGYELHSATTSATPLPSHFRLLDLTCGSLGSPTTDNLLNPHRLSSLLSSLLSSKPPAETPTTDPAWKSWCGRVMHFHSSALRYEDQLRSIGADMARLTPPVSRTLQEGPWDDFCHLQRFRCYLLRWLKENLGADLLFAYAMLHGVAREHGEFKTALLYIVSLLYKKPTVGQRRDVLGRKGYLVHGLECEYYYLKAGSPPVGAERDAVWERRREVLVLCTRMVKDMFRRGCAGDYLPGKMETPPGEELERTCDEWRLYAFAVLVKRRVDLFEEKLMEL